MVRDLGPSDAGAARRLVLDGMAERWGDAFDPDANPDAEDLWSAYVVARDGDGVVVEQDGAVVAVGVLVPEGGGVGRLLRIAVDAGHRRAGCGRAVVTALVDRARARGMDRVVVATDTPWTDAVALYVACGFRVTGHDRHDTHLALDLAAPGA